MKAILTTRAAVNAMLFAGTATLTVLAAPPVEAGVVTSYGRFGIWVVNRVEGPGNPQCTFLSLIPGDSRNVGFFTHEHGEISLGFSKDTWHIKPSTAVPVKVWFDNDDAHAWLGTGSGYQTIINVPLQGQVAKVMDDFLHSHVMHVAFPEGNEQPWTLDTTGTDKAFTAFERCVKGIETDFTQPVPPANSH